MAGLALDGFAVDPQGLEFDLWVALATLLCRNNKVTEGHPVEDAPCDSCRRLSFSLVRPVSRALLAAGKRPNNNYDLVGRGVIMLMEEAA